MPKPVLTFNPIISVLPSSSFTILDPTAIVNDGGNLLGAIRLVLGAGAGSLGVAVGGSLVTAGTIGPVAYQYDSAKRLLSLTSSTASGSDFTQVLKLVAYSQGGAALGVSQTIYINLGIPIYSPDTGHYYEVVESVVSWDVAKATASSKNLFGLPGYLATITSQAENDLIERFYGRSGALGGSSVATPAGTSASSRIWTWQTGPEAGQVFWNGASTGLYTNWFPGEPNNSGYPDSKENLQPYAFAYLGKLWYDDAASGLFAYYVEYSTVSGTGDDGLSGTRSIFNVTVGLAPTVTATTSAATSTLQRTTPIEISIINGMMTNAIGVAASNITVGPSNDTHIQVAIDLGTATNGKRREFQGLRIVSGFEKELIVNQTRVGEVYMFVFLKTVEGSSSVTLLLN